jgi:glycosyltransferase involved in cell wall biosynthesis
LRTLDVAHVHHPFVSGSLAVRFFRSRGIPVVFTNHTRYDLYSQAYLPGMPDVFSTAALQTYLPSFCRSCDVVVAPSPGMEEVLRKLGVDTPIDVVPNGVDLKPFLKDVEPISRSFIGFKPDDIILIYTGRLGPEKNIPFLLRCFAGASQAYDNIRLLIVGDGPERDNLEDRVKHMGINDRVFFTGMVPYDEMPRYLAVGDFFVTASVTEVHPLSMIEAMASGLPVLGIQSPGIGDTIVDGEAGYLVDREDLSSFTAKMVRLAVDQESRKQMGERARLLAQNYAIERTTQLMLDRYLVAIERAAQRRKSLRSRFVQWMEDFRK